MLRSVNCSVSLSEFLCVTAVCLTASGAAYADSVPDRSMTWIRHFENDSLGTAAFFNETSTATPFSNVLASPYGTEIIAHGNLETGETGIRYSATSPGSRNGQSLVSLYDTLTFETPLNSPTEVSFSFRYEGALSSFGTESSSGFNSHSMASLSVEIYDITGLSSWIESGNTPSDPIYFSSAPLLFDGNIGFAVGDEAFIEVVGPFQDETVIDLSGELFSFDLTKSGSFIADSTKEYGIEIIARGSGFGNATADFLDTGIFQFTELNGSHFNSGSGVFLSNPVPEPSMLILLAGGIGFAVVRRGRPSVG